MTTTWIRGLFVLISTCGILLAVMILNLDARLTRIESHNTITDLRLDFLEADQQKRSISYYDDMRERDVR